IPRATLRMRTRQAARCTRARELSRLRATPPASRRHRPIRVKGRATTSGLTHDLQHPSPPSVTHKASGRYTRPFETL
ncbi:MAG: hypothetical protein OXD42_06880, partial [Rhodospirillaceae bacterium]|nr:hypothetical protein [Rhodospirillaceae bacterium]